MLGSHSPHEASKWLNIFGARSSIMEKYQSLLSVDDHMWFQRFAVLGGLAACILDQKR
jgi:hypothetical protein